MNTANPGTPYDARTPPGLAGRRPGLRWERPAGTLAERLARARLVWLLSRQRNLGDWLALSIAIFSVAVLLAATGGPPAEGRLAAPHLNLDYALAAVQADAGGRPESAILYGAGPGIAALLGPGDLLAVETRVSAGWYRVERVRVTSCGTAPAPAAAMVIATPCDPAGQRRAVVEARPLLPARENWS